MNNIKVISDDTEIFKRNIELEHKLREEEKNTDYNNPIVNFYYNGKIKINNSIIDINRINLLKIKEGTDYRYILDFLDSDPLDNNFKIIKIIKFKDTRAFEELISKYKEYIIDNVLSFDEKIINYLKNITLNEEKHTLVPETRVKITETFDDIDK